MSAKLLLKVKADRKELERVSAAIKALGVDEDWSSDILFRVDLVMDELVVNIMDYGYDESDHEIDITFTSEEDAVTIEITDEGRSFDPLNDAPEPDLSSPIEERRIGGLGVYLARTMMDELVYRREGNRNHLTLVKRRI
jgi:anti-sigma regulatory factor (Ser/Thr protein kinase)